MHKFQTNEKVSWQRTKMQASQGESFSVFISLVGSFESLGAELVLAALSLSHLARVLLEAFFAQSQVLPLWDKTGKPGSPPFNSRIISSPPCHPSWLSSPFPARESSLLLWRVECEKSPRMSSLLLVRNLFPPCLRYFASWHLTEKDERPRKVLTVNQGQILSIGAHPS